MKKTKESLDHKKLILELEKKHEKIKYLQKVLENSERRIHIRKKINAIGFCLCIFVFFNLINLFAFSFYPNEVHQKYLLKKKGNIIIKKHNSLGAIGDFYQGQAFKIAIFGSCIVESYGINFDKRISQQLKLILGHKKVHIDNFAIGSSHFDSTLSQIQSLKRLKYHYDIVLISFPISQIKDAYLQYEAHFSSRWLVGHNMLILPEQIKKFFNRRKDHERLIQAFEKNKTGNRRIILDEDVTILNREMRQHPFIQSRLTNIEPPLQIEANKKKEIQLRLKELKQAAREIADKVYYSPARVIWHPYLPSDFYITITPHPKFQKDNPKFYNAKSLYQTVNFYAEKEIDFVKKTGIKILDYEKFIENLINDPKKPYAKNPEELYTTEYHFSEEGSLLVAQFLAKKFHPLLKAKTKNK